MIMIKIPEYKHQTRLIVLLQPNIFFNMRLAKKLKNFFWPSANGGLRDTGYYWVQYSYGGARTWRIGWYNAAFANWQFDGDGRVFYDEDLISIDERAILRKTLSWSDWWFWLAETFILSLLVYILSKNK